MKVKFFTVQELRDAAHKAVVSHLGREPNSKREKDQVIKYLLSCSNQSKSIEEELMKKFITQSAVTRQIFDSWEPAKQKKYLKAHPNSKFNPNRKEPIKGAKGRPKAKVSEKLADANKKFSGYKTTARKQALVKKLVGSLGAIIGRRIDTSKMGKEDAKKAVNNHIDNFLKKHAPAIHRSRIYKDMMGKGATTRVRGEGIKGVAKKEGEIKEANFKPSVRLSPKGVASLKDAIKKHNQLRKPENKEAMKNKIMDSLKKVYGEKVSPSKVDAHIKHVLKENGGAHLL